MTIITTKLTEFVTQGPSGNSIVVPKVVGYTTQGPIENSIVIPKVVTYTVTTPDGNNEQLHVQKALLYAATGMPSNTLIVNKINAYMVLNLNVSGTIYGVGVASGEGAYNLQHVASSDGISTVSGVGMSQIVNNFVANQVSVKSLQFRRGTEAELPGAPKGFPPRVFQKSLDAGELAFTTDTSRVVIGHTSKPGDIDYNRLVFPYQNIEVLTENSPRLKELFDIFVRNQDKGAFFPPTTLTSGYSGPITYSDVVGIPVVPTQIYGSFVSAVFEYHAFSIDGTTYPIQNGTLRILASIYGSSATDSNLNNGSTGLDFGVGGVEYDGSGHPYYMVYVTNLTSNDVQLFMRRVVVEG